MGFLGIILYYIVIHSIYYNNYICNKKHVKKVWTGSIYTFLLNLTSKYAFGLYYVHL